MNVYDYEVSYRMTAHLPDMNGMVDTTGAFEHIKEWDVVPFEVKKKNPMISVFISNCAISNNNRLGILEHLSRMGVTAKNHGRCPLNGPGQNAMITHDPAFEEKSWLWSRLRDNTMQPPKGAIHMARDNIYQGGSSLFYYAAENTNCEYYHTEKPWNGFNSGAVPIYLGSNLTHREFFPKHSYIHVLDFPDYDALGNHLLYLASNETAYNEYLAWRKEPLPEFLASKIASGLTSRQPERWCTLCEYLHKNWKNSSRGFKAQKPDRCS